MPANKNALIRYKTIDNCLNHSQKLIQENPDGSCEFMIKVVINFELISILLSYGAGLKVISSPVVVKYVKEQVDGMRKAYEE